MQSTIFYSSLSISDELHEKSKFIKKLFDMLTYLNLLFTFNISSISKNDYGLAFVLLKSISIKFELFLNRSHINFIESSYIPTSTSANF